MITIHTPYDRMTQDLGEGLTEGEYYFWQEHKRRENLEHRSMGHKDFCKVCHNCTCGDKRFRCICASGKIWATPYRIRFRGNIPVTDLKRLQVARG